MAENDYGLPDEVTEQSLFDKSARHLLSMTEVCGDHDPLWGDIHCAYRDGNGNACAVGCLISDDDYDAKIETRQAAELIAGIDRGRFIPTPPMFPPSMVAYDRLLTALQSVHDTKANRYPDSRRFIPGAIRAHLYRVARDLKLKTDVLEDVSCSPQL